MQSWKRFLLCGAAAVLAANGLASAQWQNRLVDPPAGFGDNGEVNDINEAETILASPPAGSTTTTSASDVINFPTDAPAGFAGTDDFATESVGVVDILSGTTGTFNLYVNGDDGFRLRRNGTVIGEFPGPTGNSNTTLPNVTLSDGDVLSLSFFERNGGEFNQFRVNDANGAFVGSTESGIDIVPVPEPASLGLLGLGGLGLLARRRRAR